MKIGQQVAKFWKFISNDIWRVTEDEVTKRKFSFYTIIKTLYIAIDQFTKDRILNRASALTYSTLLAIVPILAIVFAIARGFGFANLVENQFRDAFGGVNDTTETILHFVDSYLSQTKSGIFIGIGLILLLWTVINLINNIERTFNQIWDIKKSRTPYRKLTDYFSVILLVPLLIVISAGASIFVSTIMKGIEDFVILAPIIKFLIRSVPFVLVWLMFTGLYMYMPNTKVKFRYALVAGILAGTAYQLFQYIYISGQLWVSRYNAIYGSFAALPLFLLWLQTSWTICLFGVEFTYAGQNVNNFSFDKDTRNISRRYRDFISILIMSIIVKQFQSNETPYTAEEISQTYKIPIRLTKQVLYQLQEIKLIHEFIIDDKTQEIGFLPSVDINQLNVATLLDRIDTFGSEDFKIDTETEYSQPWQVLIEAREEYYRNASQVLLKDL